MTKKRILVIGGVGFIGTNLCKNLLRDGHDVVCWDFFSGEARKNLLALIGSPNFSVIDAQHHHPKNFAFDEIFNLCTRALPSLYQVFPQKNQPGVPRSLADILQYAAVNGVPLLQAFANEDYGKPGLYRREHLNLGPNQRLALHCIDDASGDLAAPRRHNRQSLQPANSKQVRITGAYGPYMQAHGRQTIANFVVQALLNQPLFIDGEGSEKLSYCFVEDVVVGLRALMASPIHRATAFELDSGDAITTMELARQVIELTGSHSPIVFATSPHGTAIKHRANLRNAQMHLAWPANTPLVQGLKHTIDYFEHMLGEGAAAAYLMGRGKLMRSSRALADANA